MIKRAQIELPPEIARRFFEDLRLYHREQNPIKADEIAARQLRALRQYQRPREKEAAIVRRERIIRANARLAEIKGTGRSQVSFRSQS
jgi:hypothetical protein